MRTKNSQPRKRQQLQNRPKNKKQPKRRKKKKLKMPRNAESRTPLNPLPALQQALSEEKSARPSEIPSAASSVRLSAVM